MECQLKLGDQPVTVEANEEFAATETQPVQDLANHIRTALGEDTQLDQSKLSSIHASDMVRAVRLALESLMDQHSISYLAGFHMLNRAMARVSPAWRRFLRWCYLARVRTYATEHALRELGLSLGDFAAVGYVLPEAPFTVPAVLPAAHVPITATRICVVRNTEDTGDRISIRHNGFKLVAERGLQLGGPEGNLWAKNAWLTPGIIPMSITTKKLADVMDRVEIINQIRRVRERSGLMAEHFDPATGRRLDLENSSMVDTVVSHLLGIRMLAEKLLAENQVGLVVDDQEAFDWYARYIDRCKCHYAYVERTNEDIDNDAAGIPVFARLGIEYAHGSPPTSLKDRCVESDGRTVAWGAEDYISTEAVSVLADFTPLLDVCSCDIVHGECVLEKVELRTLKTEDGEEQITQEDYNKIAKDLHDPDLDSGAREAFSKDLQRVVRYTPAGGDEKEVEASKYEDMVAVHILPQIVKLAPGQLLRYNSDGLQVRISEADISPNFTNRRHNWRRK